MTRRCAAGTGLRDSINAAEAGLATLAKVAEGSKALAAEAAWRSQLVKLVLAELHMECMAWEQARCTHCLVCTLINLGRR